MTYSPTWLTTQIATNQPLSYIYFWGHRPKPDGKISKTCLSQWFARGFDHDGHHYPTAEHWMMAGKAKLFGDEEAFAAILAEPDPKEVKWIGRQVKNYEEEKWAAKRTEIVVEGNLHKFSAHDDLKTFLLSTGDRVIVEASPYDKVWGIGMKAVAAQRVAPTEWPGTNWLGFCLMEVRDRLR